MITGSEPEQNKKFLLLQVNDALFPIGGYAHSYGLETYIQKGLVTNEQEAWNFLQNRLRYGMLYNELLCTRLALEYAAEKNEKKLCGLEELIEASFIPRETREAGNKLGSRFAKTVRSMEISYESEIFEKHCENRKGKSMAYSVVYGVFCAAAGIPAGQALEHCLYARTSAMVTNCVKIIPLSQTFGQRLLVRSYDLMSCLLQEVYELTEEDLCRSAPGFDIRSMQHESLYSRLYMS